MIPSVCGQLIWPTAICCRPTPEPPVHNAGKVPASAVSDTGVAALTKWGSKCALPACAGVARRTHELEDMDDRGAHGIGRVAGVRAGQPIFPGDDVGETIAVHVDDLHRVRSSEIATLL